MLGIQLFSYELKKSSDAILRGRYDSAIWRCGRISEFLAYHFLRTNGLIEVKRMMDIPDVLERLGEAGKFQLLSSKGILTSVQARALLGMSVRWSIHNPHLFRRHRYIGIRCLVDGMRSIRGLRHLLDDENFVTKIPENLVPECVWGFWLG
jgi:hypothetical protein